MEWINKNILTLLIFLPLLGALLLALVPRAMARPGALLIAALNFVASLHLWAHWNFARPGYAYEQKMLWLPSLGVEYHVGVDGLSLFLVLLTTFLTPIVLIASWNEGGNRAKEFLIYLLLLEGATIGVFTALDLILFYIFWEAVLVPVYLLIGIFGGPRRGYAAIKFFIYTMAGSVLMWVAMLYLFTRTGGSSFALADIQDAAGRLYEANPTVGVLLFCAFALAFAIKVPLFPLHSWLPDAYSEAPTGATVMLAAVMSKMGAYGFLRFAIPLFPRAANEMAPLFMLLAVIGIIYGAIVAVRQTDMKRVIAYSSLSHLGFIVLGIFAGVVAYRQNDTGSLGIGGATLQMVSHGITTGALFLIVGMLAERRGTREIGEFGGLAKAMPTFTVLFWIALFGSIGLPGLSGFVGEFLILQGSMHVDFWFTAAAATGVILGAVYMLRLFGSVMFGEATREENRAVRDVTYREGIVLVALLAVTVWMGVAPQPFLDAINNAATDVARLAQHEGPRPALTYNAESRHRD